MPTPNASLPTQPPQFKRRTSWPGLSEDMRRLFDDLNSRIYDAVTALVAWVQPRNRHVVVRGDYQARPGDFVEALAGGTILLPAPAKGAEILVVRSTTELVTVVASSGTVDGLPSVIPAESRSRCFISSAYGWHSNG